MKFALSLVAFVFLVLGPVALQCLAKKPASCAPIPEAQKTLGKLSGVLTTMTEIEKGKFPNHPAKFIGILPGGQLYFEVCDMDVDDDGTRAGSPADWEPHPVRRGTDRKTMVRRDIVDSAHQDITSFGAISAFQVPYVVLPTAWMKGHALRAGMGAVVVRGSQLLYAVVGDFGPDKIGEMSILAHEKFGETMIVDGFKPVRDGGGKPVPGAQPGTLQKELAKVTRNSGTKGPFEVFVFPEVKSKKPFKSVDDSLQPALREAWSKLTGQPAP